MFHAHTERYEIWQRRVALSLSWAYAFLCNYYESISPPQLGSPWVNHQSITLPHKQPLAPTDKSESPGNLTVGGSPSNGGEPTQVPGQRASSSYSTRHHWVLLYLSSLTVALTPDYSGRNQTIQNLKHHLMAEWRILSNTDVPVGEICRLRFGSNRLDLPKPRARTLAGLTITVLTA